MITDPSLLGFVTVMAAEDPEDAAA